MPATEPMDVDAIGLVREGIALARRGCLQQARALLRRATELDPASEDAWLWLASVEAPDQAIRSLERVLAINPGNDRARTSLHDARLQAGISAGHSGDRIAARGQLLAVIARDPDCVVARLWLASLASSPTEALIHARHVLMLDPANERALQIQTICSSRLAEEEVGVVEPTTQPKVLIVDDSPHVRRFVGLTLERYGCEVLTASNGNVAMQLVAECGAPHLAFLDATLSSPDGYSLAEQLHQRPGGADIAVILLSCRGAQLDPERSRQAGAVECLAKPIAPEAILEAVQRYGLR